jgi:hypothetical protein
LLWTSHLQVVSGTTGSANEDQREGDIN